MPADDVTPQDSFIHRNIFYFIYLIDITLSIINIDLIYSCLL